MSEKYKIDTPLDLILTTDEDRLNIINEMTSLYYKVFEVLFSKKFDDTMWPKYISQANLIKM
jgi:hypothetical protein